MCLSRSGIWGAQPPASSQVLPLSVPDSRESLSQQFSARLTPIIKLVMSMAQPWPCQRTEVQVFRHMRVSEMSILFQIRISIEVVIGLGALLLHTAGTAMPISGVDGSVFKLMRPINTVDILDEFQCCAVVCRTSSNSRP